MKRPTAEGKTRQLPCVMRERIPILATFLVVSFGLVVGIPVIVGADDRTSQTEDRKALEQRWNALIAERRNPDVAKWNSLEADFRSFAKKYDLHLEEHAKRAKSGPPGVLPDAAFAACPPRDDVPGYRCCLFPGPKGVCRYVSMPAQKKCVYWTRDEAAQQQVCGDFDGL